MDKIYVNVAGLDQDAIHHQVIWCGKNGPSVYNMYLILIVVNCGLI